MAKSLGIRVSPAAGISNPEAIDNAVLTPITPSGNLGSIVDSILRAASVAMVCVVDLDARIVHARPTNGTNTVTTIDAVAGTTVVGTLKQLEEGRSAVFIDAANSAPLVSVNDGGAGPLERLAVTPKLVSRSISSLISAIEDDIAADVSLLGFDLGGGEVPLIVVDQGTERVTLFSVAAANVAAVRALFADGGSLEDQARYEQIPAEEAAGASALAFE